MVKDTWDYKFNQNSGNGFTGWHLANYHLTEAMAKFTTPQQAPYFLIIAESLGKGKREDMTVKSLRALSLQQLDSDNAKNLQINAPVLQKWWWSHGGFSPLGMGTIQVPHTASRHNRLIKEERKQVKNALSVSPKIIKRKKKSPLNTMTTFPSP